MGFHLASGALNQAALARDHARAAAACWLISALAFVGWMVSPLVSGQVLRAFASLLLADHLLDLRAQAAQGFLQGRHLGHDVAHPPGEFVVRRLFEVQGLCHRHTIIGQRVSHPGADQPAEG